MKLTTKLWALALFAVLSASAQTEPSAKITFYREKSLGNRWLTAQSTVVGMNRGWVNPNYHWRVFVDGKEFAVIRTNRFVTLNLSPGQHDIWAKNADHMIVDLKAGEHEFIHLGVVNCLKCIHIKSTFTASSCAEVIDAVANAGQPAPTRRKDVLSGVITQEVALPGCAQ